MDLKKIKALIDLLSNSTLSELELEEGDWRLRLSRDAVPVAGKAGVIAANRIAPPAVSVSAAKPSLASQASLSVAADRHVVTSPMFGVLCLAPAPDKPPFVQIGDAIHKGQKLCMLEAMKLFHALEAERDGKIVAILAENGQEVDVGQALFRIE